MHLYIKKEYQSLLSDYVRLINQGFLLGALYGDYWPTPRERVLVLQTYQEVSAILRQITGKVYALIAETLARAPLQDDGLLTIKLE